MARGVTVVLPNATHRQVLVPAGMSFPSLAILNPNDGVIYAASDHDVPNLNAESWDWKVPSQSYALLPGNPDWRSVGMYYLDQSGAGRQGEITIYPVLQKTTLPVFQSIGRALQAQATTLDITEGSSAPANPAAGVARLWADTSGFVHILDSAGVDRTIWDSSKFHTIGNLAAQPTLAVDAWTNAGMASGYNAIASFGSFSFITYIPNSIVLAVVKASVQIVFPPTATQCGFNLVVDTLHHRLPRRNFPTTLQDYVSSQTVVLQALNTGTHTAQLYLYSSAAVASGFYLRSATAPEGEFCQVSIIELMGVGT